MRRILATAVVATIAIGGGDVFAGKLKSSWKAPGLQPTSYAGKKVATLVITDDLNIQMSGEEALARELEARGVLATPTYRLIPREELKSAEKVQAWLTRGTFEAVVVMRVVSAEKEVSYNPVMFSSGYYTTFGGYYGYGYSSVTAVGKPSTDMVVTIEALIFSVADGKLLWASVSEKTNPKGAGPLVKELVKDITSEMKKEGLLAGKK
jgi:hypothetical protein